MSTTLVFPGPDATHAEVDAWYKANTPAPDQSDDIPHEAPEVENGPSLVCNACGVVRVALTTPFCKGCTDQIKAAVGGDL